MPQHAIQVVQECFDAPIQRVESDFSSSGMLFGWAQEYFQCAGTPFWRKCVCFACPEVPCKGLRLCSEVCAKQECWGINSDDVFVYVQTKSKVSVFSPDNICSSFINV